MELEDQVCEAQDAFFENRLEDVVRICGDIVRAGNHEKDVYEIYGLSLSRLQRYEELRMIAEQWGVNCGRTEMQLMLFVEGCYLSNDYVKLLEALNVLKQVFQGHISVRMNKSKSSTYPTALCLALDLATTSNSTTNLDEIQKIYNEHYAVLTEANLSRHYLNPLKTFAECQFQILSHPQKQKLALQENIISTLLAFTEDMTQDEKDLQSAISYIISTEICDEETQSKLKQILLQRQGTDLSPTFDAILLLLSPSTTTSTSLNLSKVHLLILRRISNTKN